ncbi:MAG: molybdopterin converting factor [Crocinitomicaceae bacterium]|nr:molybdopterin converting factor [Crocinitomicaceae bacterium]|tara:strand:+ start:1624 stop:2073 length:450 start_codon:yes stop_codon:yes gene_type:complete
MEKKVRKPKPVFKDGAISAESIGKSIANHQSKVGIGGHSIFLGQVRADEIDGKTVAAIEFSAHEEMAQNEIFNIREETFEKFDLTCMHIYHSKGVVNVGEICLFVFTSSAHRKECQAATDYIVEELKKRATIFGREIFEDESHQWKVNN